MAGVALALFAAPAAAQSPQNQLPNGSYYGYDWATNGTFLANVKNGYIYGAEYFTQLFNGTPGQLIPGTVSSEFGNINGSFGPGNKGYPIAANGSWGMASDIPPGEGITVPTICGDTKYNAKLVASWDCTFQGTNPVMAGNGQFSVQRTTTPGPTSGIYSGPVQTSAVPGNPNAPWTGTTGWLVLVVANDTVSGYATLAPVDPSTGVITGPPSVNVTYGPNAVPSSTTIGSGADEVLSGIDSYGFFSLASNPQGYTLKGAFLPGGIPGLPSNGMVAGTVTTCTPQKDCGTGGSNPVALPGSFQINGTPQ
jgi:hypothetical protein